MNLKEDTVQNKYLEIIYSVTKIANYQNLYSANKRSYRTDDFYYENEVHILSEIVENNTISLIEIASQFYKTKSYISQVISSLEAKKLIVKETSKIDSRKRIYTVTEKGMLIYSAHKEYDEKQSERLAASISDFSGDEITVVMRFLEAFHRFQLEDENAVATPRKIKRG